MKNFHINEENATLGNVNGMGKISLPNMETGELGSGDVINPKKKKLKKFKEIQEIIISEREVFFHISMINDTAGLVLAIEQGLKTKFKFDDNITNELMDINISYNGLVDLKSIIGLSKIIGISAGNLKTEIQNIIDRNIKFLNESIEKTLEDLILGKTTLNESILGRALGAIGGFALGPKVGQVIARVLGIKENGPLYNVLTSRVVSAALAQELTKNLI